MSDDTSSAGSLFRSAGFAMPGDWNNAPVKQVQPAAVSPGSGSLFSAAGFQLPGNSPVDDSWQEREAQANLAAIGYDVPKKPGRGIVQALKDYPAHVWHGILGIPEGVATLAAAPGNILASQTPSTSESLIPTAVGLAGIEAGLPTGAIGGAAKTAAMAKVGTSAQAVNRLVEAIGPENVPAVVNRLQANPRLALADVSDPVRTMTQGLIDPAQPQVQNAISGAVKNRLQGATQATNDAYTAAMGPAPNVGTMVEGLKDRARSAGQKAIQPALKAAGPVDVTPVIAAIDEKLKPGVNPLLDPGSKLPLSAEQEALARIKQQLTTGEGETLFDAQRLHRVQSDIGDQAYQLSKSGDPKDRMLGSQLRNVNEKLVDAIDEAAGPVPLAPGQVRVNIAGGKYVDVPQGRPGLEKLADPNFIEQNARPVDEGAYRAGRAKFKDAKDISAAFESGFDTLKNRSGLAGAVEDTPDALRAWMKEASPEEVVARRLGTRADIDQKINGVKNGALAGQTITKIEYNKEKLRALFGDNEANRLISNMEDAQDMATTNAKILANSKTAETLAGQKALSVPKVGGGNPLMYVAPVAAEMLGQGAGLPGVGFAASMLAKGAHMGIQKGLQKNALARNLEFGNAAMATGPARDIIINRLMAHPKVQRARQ